MIRSIYYNSKTRELLEVEPDRIPFLDRLLRNLPSSIRRIVEQRSSSFTIFLSDVSSPFLLISADDNTSSGLAGSICRHFNLEPLYKSEIALLNDSLFKELPLAVTESVGVDKLYLIDLVFPYSSIIVMHNTAVMSRVASYRGIRLDSIDISYLDYLPRPIIDIYPRDLEKIGLDILRLLENCKSCKNLVELYEKEKKLLIHYLHGLGRARGRVNSRPIALLGGDLIMVLCLRASIWYELKKIGYLIYTHLVKLDEKNKLDIALPKLVYFEIHVPERLIMFFKTFRSIELLLDYSTHDTLSLVLRLMYSIMEHSKVGTASAPEES